LRRAGYHALATDCENQSDLWNGMLASAGAQHTIGKEYAYGGTPPLASLAYGASAHAATCAFYAGHDDIEAVIETGNYCARALLELLLEKAEAAGIWEFAVRAINTAINLADVAGDPQSSR